MANGVLMGKGLGVLISLLEIVMIVFGLCTFDFADNTDVWYMVSYGFMLGVGLSAYLSCRFFKKTPAQARALHVMILVYGAVILLWSACVSWLDMRKGQYPIVFFTLAMGFSGCFFMYPEELFGILIPTFAIFYTGCLTVAGAPFDVGFLINLLIFLTVASFIGVFKYRRRMSEYLYKRKTVESSAKLADAVKSLHELNARLERESVTDRLTGVKNRWALGQHLLDGKSAEFTGAVMLDLDHFKSVNDRYGHPVGDEVLREFAETVRLTAETDEIYRMGGEEFLVLLKDVTVEETYETAERIRAAVADTRFTSARLRMSVSCGVSGVRADDGEDRLWSHADAALYEAKRKGRDRTEIYREEEHGH